MVLIPRFLGHPLPISSNFIRPKTLRRFVELLPAQEVAPRSLSGAPAFFLVVFLHSFFDSFFPPPPLAASDSKNFRHEGEFHVLSHLVVCSPRFIPLRCCPHLRPARPLLWRAPHVPRELCSIPVGRFALRHKWRLSQPLSHQFYARPPTSHLLPFFSFVPSR